MYPARKTSVGKPSLLACSPSASAAAAEKYCKWHLQIQERADNFWHESHKTLGGAQIINSNSTKRRFETAAEAKNERLLLPPGRPAEERVNKKEEECLGRKKHEGEIDFQ